MVRITAQWLMLLVIAVPLIAGSLFHALIPHSHASHPVVVDLLHTVAHPAIKDSFTVAIIAVALITVYAIAYISTSAQYHSAYALAAIGENERLRSVRRGVVKYRRFG